MSINIRKQKTLNKLAFDVFIQRFKHFQVFTF